jgi:hypothetical protein
MNPEAVLRHAGGQTEAHPPALVHAAAPARTIWFDDSEWDEGAIPRRPWLAVGYLLRGSVTAIVGPGGISKSSLMLTWAVHLAHGIPCHRMAPLGSFRVMIYNVEDDSDEQRRRLSAILGRLGKTPRDIAGKIARIGPESTGTLIDRGESGIQVDTAAMQELERHIEDFRPDVLILDPLAELHTSEENDNTALRGVVARFRALAARHNIAVVLLHHTRKGITAPGDADTARGASSIVSAARVVLTITGMTEDDARKFGLTPDARKHHFRLDGGKSNYAGLTDGEWFERITVLLANGDAVAAVAPWQPPVDIVTTDVIVALTESVAKGSALGPWSPQIGNTERSVKRPMMDAGLTTLTGQRAALTALQEAGFQSLKYRNAQRRMVSGLRSPEGEPRGFQWEDSGKK